MIGLELPALKSNWRPWQFKALGTTNCNCWDCLRKLGITPDRNSHESHRRNVLPGSPLYDTSNGKVMQSATIQN